MVWRAISYTAGVMLLIWTACGNASSEPKEAEAPVMIRSEEGSWTAKISPDQVPSFARHAQIAYQAEVFPRLGVNILKLECEFGGGERITITGLIPDQSFPQPEMALGIGDQGWNGIPSAKYIARSEPDVHPKPAGLKFGGKLKDAKNISWPGHPPYAELSFFQRFDPALLQALRSGQPLRVNFNGQERTFPAVPATMASQYADACGKLVPPSVSLSEARPKEFSQDSR